MTGSRMLAVASIDARILWRDPSSVLVMAVAPLLFVPFFAPGVQAQLSALGYSDAPGAAYAVPSLAVLFSLLSVQHVATGFFRDRQWHTWGRLRAAPVSLPALLLGKCATAVLAQLLQLTIVLGGGALLYGFAPTGSWGALSVVVLLFSLTMVCFGAFVVAVSRTLEQALTIAALGGIVLAGIGGAFGPVDLLPSWAQAVAPASPASWTLDAVRALVLDGAGWSAIAPQLLALAAFAAAFAAASALAFRLGARGRWA